MARSTKALARRIAPAAAAAIFFAVMIVIFVSGRSAAYEATLRGWGVDPFRFPFVDVETVLSAVRCLKAGVDVLASNPCDPVRRTFDYSPLWLLLARLPITEAWTMPAGLMAVGSFIASLLLLPAGRTVPAAVVITLGAISSAVVFGVERGNNDLVLFVLAALAASLSCRGPGLRLVGYGAALLAGLLKYYPMTLLVLSTRERPARFIGVAVGSLTIVLIFVATMGEDLARALRLVPAGGFFGDMFGSAILPGGLVRQFGWSADSAFQLRVGLSVGAFLVGGALAARPFMRDALARLTDTERMMLLAGGVLMLSCFFTAQNIGYRALHLVLTLPGLTALSRAGAGRLWTLTAGTALALLWAQGWRNWFFSQELGRPVFINGWLIREALWWWTITMLIALVLGLLLRSEIGLRVVGRARVRPGSETRDS
jgi:hypothetical protein